MSDDIFDEIQAELSDPLGYTQDDEPEAAAIPLNQEPPFRIPRGKYQGLVLPRMIGVKPSLYDKVNALRDQIIADPEFQRHASSISQTYAELRREAQEKAEELAEIKLRMTAVMLMMIDQFEVEGTSTITHKNGDTIRVQPEPHLIVIDKPTFRRSCLEASLGDLMSLPWATANKLMKDRALEGFEPFDGAQLYVRPKVFFSNGQKKGNR